jgi:hypothetical protein
MTCQKVSKVIIGVTNGLILLVALIGSIVVYVEYDKIVWSDYKDLKLPAIFLLVVAAVMIVSAIIGIFSVCRVKKGCTVAYLAIIFLVILVEVVGIAIAYTYAPNIIETIEEKWPEMEWRERIEKEFNCCGWTNISAPCVYSQRPCKDAIIESANKWLLGIGAAIIVLAVVEILLLVSTICLLCSKTSADEDHVQPF